jgi:glyoxylase-like metal-dependent hydrolase (beta-lactamase superfamily II)
MTMTPTIHTIDLKFLGEPAAIAAFAVEDEAGVTLVECGPFATNDNLVKGLEEAGINPNDVHTLLLSHIHFDHAGAAWWWAQHGTQVYVHPKGLKHMIDPTRLYASAARIYGDENMERLWGKMEKIDEYDIAAVTDRSRLTFGGNTWVAHHTPGHASHHVSWQLGNIVFTGDVGGVKIKGGPVVPPLPPPDINLTQWNDSLLRLRSLRADKFDLTHYGPVDAPSDHLSQRAARFDGYVNWVGEARHKGQSEEELTAGFTEFVEADLRANGVTEEVIGAYRAANPPGMSVAGILRWFTYLEA